jgi:hypothetical protein
MCRYQEWDRERHELGYCPANVVSDGLCQEHLEWVADCQAPSVSKLDMKYGYKWPTKRKAKLEPAKVFETIEPPGTYAKAYNAYAAEKGKAAASFYVWLGFELAKAPGKLADYQRGYAESQATEQVAKAERASIVAIADSDEPNTETVHGFRFEYRAEGGSGFYWNGKRVASTREGLERMGPAVLAKVCK